MSKLWGGRFSAETDEAVRRLNDSFRFDQRLWREDIDGSIAHATMLGETAILEKSEAQCIVSTLRDIRSELEAKHIWLPDEAEDIHSAIEMLLRQRVGDLAGKLHTARSRNDQVATDLRLFVRRSIDDISERIQHFQESLLSICEHEIETIMPGYTHLQRAQPIRLAHHLLAYFWMFQRDRERLADTRRRVNVSPLGAGALAGTTFEIDRERTAQLLGFEGVAENSVDAVSDRDFVVEFLSACAILAVHISKMGEELVLWSSHEFGFVTLHDSVSTGSSMMPQKKNPDVPELARGKAGRVIGHLVALLTVVKGLPLAYNKDLQEDKEPIFDTVDTLCMVLPALQRTLETATFNRKRMADTASEGFSTYTDLADELVRQGESFRAAHHKVGRLIADSVSDQKGEQTFSSLGVNFDDSAVASIERRHTFGGTAKDSVLGQIRIARQKLT